jgi:hypothetical protein
LQATALVNEAYLRLILVKQVQWQNRAHFFALSARVMRRILVDFARARGQDKRGGGVRKVTLDEALVVSPQSRPDLVALDEALRALGHEAAIVEAAEGTHTAEDAAAALAERCRCERQTSHYGRDIGSCRFEVGKRLRRTSVCISARRHASFRH